MIAQSSTPMTACGVGGQVAPSTVWTPLRSPRGGIVVAGRHYRGGVFLPPSARPEVKALAAKATVAARGPVVIGLLGYSYRVEPLAIAPSVGTHAFSLMDLDRNRLHHVHRSAAGEVRCDCGDFTFRRAGTGVPCKHGARLVELGLIPATTPRVLPPFAARAEPPGLTPPVRPRPRRFEPGPAEMAEAAALLGWR